MSCLIDQRGVSKTHDLLNLRALKLQRYIKLISFNAWVRYFVYRISYPYIETC